MQRPPCVAEIRNIELGLFRRALRHLFHRSASARHIEHPVKETVLVFYGEIAVRDIVLFFNRHFAAFKLFLASVRSHVIDRVNARDVIVKVVVIVIHAELGKFLFVFVQRKNRDGRGDVRSGGVRNLNALHQIERIPRGHRGFGQSRPGKICFAAAGTGILAACKRARRQKQTEHRRTYNLESFFHTCLLL